MPNVVPFLNPSVSVAQAPDNSVKLITDLVDGANRLISESNRCRNFILHAFGELDVAERRAVLVRDGATRSALLGILADKRKSLTLLDQTLATEHQSFNALIKQIGSDEVPGSSTHLVNVSERQFDRRDILNEAAKLGSEYSWGVSSWLASVAWNVVRAGCRRPLAAHSR